MPLVTELPKNILSPEVRQQRDAVCLSSLHAASQTKTTKSKLLASQVDCSIHGAAFDAVSEARAAWSLRKSSSGEEGKSWRSSCEPPRNPITHVPASVVPAAFDHPHSDARKKISLNVVRRQELSNSSTN